MKLIYKKTFQKQLIKLGPKVKNKFKSKLKLFLNDKTNSILNYHKLKGSLSKFSSINISGDIRVLFIEQGDELIIFYMIGTHSELYG